MTTKQQERDALEKIRKIVDGLGPDSYIATAFAGCFEDAERNIDDDAAYSMKGRLESAEKRIKDLEDQKATLEARFDSTRNELNKAIEGYHGKVDRLTGELAEAKKHILGGWLYKDLWVFLTDEAKRCRDLMAGSADVMADMADTPQDIAFTNAVENYRKNKERAEVCEQMAAAVDEIGLED